MARKQSSIISFGGSNHKEIFFNGHYHDAMYIGSQLVWEKINQKEPNRRFAIVFHGTYKNELYGLGYIMKENYQTVSKAICKYNFETLLWEKICNFTASSWNPSRPTYPTWAEFGEKGVYVQNGNEIDRAKPYFITYEGQYYDLPNVNITFKSKKNATNNGYIDIGFVQNLGYQIVYRNWLSNEIITAIPFDNGFSAEGRITYNESDGYYYAITYLNSVYKIVKIKINDDNSLFSELVYQYNRPQTYPLNYYNNIEYDEMKNRVFISGQSNIKFADYRSVIWGIDGVPLFTESENAGSNLYRVSGYNDEKTILYKRIDTYTAYIKKDFFEPAIVVTNRTGGLPDMSNGMTLWTDKDEKEHLFWLNNEINSDGTMTNLNPDYYNMID